MAGPHIQGPQYVGVRLRESVLGVGAFRTRRVIAVDTQAETFQSPGQVVLPRSPQPHAGQQARLPALEVVRRDPQTIHLHVDPARRQVGQLDPLGVFRQGHQPDGMVLDFPVRRRSGRLQRSAAVDPHPGKRLPQDGRCRGRDCHRVHARPEPAADELLGGLPLLVPVEVDPAVHIGGSVGQRLHLDEYVIHLAHDQRRDHDAVFVVTARRVEVVAQRVRVRLAVRFLVRTVGPVAQPGAGDDVASAVVNRQGRVAGRERAVRRVAPIQVDHFLEPQEEGQIDRVRVLSVIRMPLRIPQFPPEPRQLAARVPHRVGPMVVWPLPRLPAELAVLRSDLDSHPVEHRLLRRAALHERLVRLDGDVDLPHLPISVCQQFACVRIPPVLPRRRHGVVQRLVELPRPEIG